MMRAALQDQIELVQYILRIIMRMPKLKVTHMETQKDLLQPGQGRSLTLDVWAVDADGTQYNIEIQRDSRGAAGSRARYHGAAIDTAALRANQKMTELPKTRIIFITENDCIGDGKLLHRFAMRDIEDGMPLDTGQEILYLNTAYEGDVRAGDEELAALAHDFRCTDPEKMQLAPLADRMRFLKDTEKGRIEVSSVIEQYATQKAEKAAKEAAEKVAEKAAKEATDAERQRAEQRDLQRACQLFATGKHDVSELAALFNLDVSVLSQACGLQQA